MVHSAAYPPSTPWSGDGMPDLPIGSCDLFPVSAAIAAETGTNREPIRTAVLDVRYAAAQGKSDTPETVNLNTDAAPYGCPLTDLEVA